MRCKNSYIYSRQAALKFYCCSVMLVLYSDIEKFAAQLGIQMFKVTVITHENAVRGDTTLRTAS